MLVTGIFYCAYFGLFIFPRILMMFRITHLKSVWEQIQDIDKKLLIKSDEYWTTEKRILSGFIATLIMVFQLHFLYVYQIR